MSDRFKLTCPRHIRHRGGQLSGVVHIIHAPSGRFLGEAIDEQAGLAVIMSMNAVLDTADKQVAAAYTGIFGKKAGALMKERSLEKHHGG